MSDKEMIEEVMAALPDSMEGTSLAALIVCITATYGVEGESAEKFFRELADRSKELATIFDENGRKE